MNGAGAREANRRMWETDIKRYLRGIRDRLDEIIKLLIEQKLLELEQRVGELEDEKGKTDDSRRADRGAE